MIAKINKIEKVLSFDQAANQSGWCYWENEKPIEWGLIQPSPKSAKDGTRLNSLYKQFESLITKYNPSIVLAEPPIGDDDDGKGHKTLFILAQVEGLIEMLVDKYNLRFCLVPAAQWQFNCGIHKRDRTSRKSGAMAFVQKQFNIPEGQLIQDEADALCIGYSYFVQRERDRQKNEGCAF